MMNYFFSFLLVLLTIGLETNAMDRLALDENKFQEESTPSQLKLQNTSGINLPLTIMPCMVEADVPVVFFISGDGGWTIFDVGVSKMLTANGMSVIGLDSRKYFWNEKQPQQVADEISSAVEYYMKLWNKNSFVLLGYSFGACIAPFIADDFSPTLKDSLKGVYCFSPVETGDFEIHISDLLKFKTNEKYNVLSEMNKISLLNPICVLGEKEDSVLRKHFSDAGITVLTLPGDHHYNYNFQAVATIICKSYLKEPMKTNSKGQIPKSKSKKPKLQ